jgi:hypothetical protein
MFSYDTGPTPSAIVNESFMEIFVWTSDLLFPEVCNFLVNYLLKIRGFKFSLIDFING